jgi:hypothetical protein
MICPSCHQPSPSEICFNCGRKIPVTLAETLEHLLERNSPVKSEPMDDVCPLKGDLVKLRDKERLK